MWGAILQDARRASPDAICDPSGRFSLPVRASPTTSQAIRAPVPVRSLVTLPSCPDGQCCEKLSISQPLSPHPQSAFSINLLSTWIPLTDVTQSAPELRIWKLTLAYDGTDFHGWQVQPGEPTIQGELQSAIARVTGESPLPQGSGRTDAGVHALAQVASFSCLRPFLPRTSTVRSTARCLPSIRVLSAALAPDDFHARHSAIAKTYEYRIFRGEVCPPFLVRYVYPAPGPWTSPPSKDQRISFLANTISSASPLPIPTSPHVLLPLPMNCSEK